MLPYFADLVIQLSRRILSSSPPLFCRNACAALLRLSHDWDGSTIGAADAHGNRLGLACSMRSLLGLALRALAFTERRVISESAEGALAVFAADLDSDGDVTGACGLLLFAKRFENVSIRYSAFE